MELSELQVFVTVVKERSFSRAAAKLHRTQPAVSQSIRRLEDELDERLFDRSSKGGHLTEAGQVLLGAGGAGKSDEENRSQEQREVVHAPVGSVHAPKDRAVSWQKQLVGEEALATNQQGIACGLNDL